ncbi:MAG: hypothetical protein HY689_11830, partial [Chloroflexi bacterium]|nr:hypothetical protein [Chloroflexota bacterium]
MAERRRIALQRMDRPVRRALAWGRHPGPVRLGPVRRRVLGPALRVLAALVLVLSSLPLSVLVPPAASVAPPVAQAASFIVNSTLDWWDATPGDGICETAPGNGECTLRAAIMEANASPGDDTITLPVGTYTLAIAPDATPDDAADGDLDITGNLTLEGAGAASTIIQACDADADPTCTGIDRVFHVLSGAEVTVSGVTVRKGNTASWGGGVYNAGTLTVSQSTISDNSAAVSGGGVYNEDTLTVSQSTISDNSSDEGGGILTSWGTATVSSSTLSGNSASSYGGGIYQTSLGTLTVVNSTISANSAFSGGGISNHWGTLTVSQSTISGNSATGGGGITNGNSGTATVNQSTISVNSASGDGGGVYNSGTLVISNSTFSGNYATSGGGILNEGTLTVSQSAISGNSSDHYGGGIANTGTLTLRNSIIAGNTATTYNNCYASVAFTSNGYNLSSDASCFTAGGTDLLNTDPLLGPLQDNGGPTFTHALLAGSPAIDAVPLAACTDAAGNPLTADQRGALRPFDGNSDGAAACDSGAFEFGAPIPVSGPPGGGSEGGGSAGSPPPTVSPKSMFPVSGDGQTGGTTLPLPFPFVVQVNDVNGPVTGHPVSWAVVSAPAGATGQALEILDTTTNGDGTAAVRFTLGDQPGSYTVAARSDLNGDGDTLDEGEEVPFTATAVSVLIRLSPETLRTNVGADPMDVAIRVEAGQPLDGVQVRLTYDPTALQVVDGDPAAAGVQLVPGPDFGQVLASWADPTTGVIEFAAGRSTSQPAPSGSILLATITLQGLTEGSHALDFDLAGVVAAYQGQEVAATLRGGQVEVSSYRLVFTAQPVRGAAGYILGVQPVVAIKDAQGNTRTSDNSTEVTLTLTVGSGGTTVPPSLICDQTVEGVTRAVVVNGVAVFSGCTIDQPMAGFILWATAPGLASAVIGVSFNVTLAGDTNGDGRVSIADFSLIVTHFGKTNAHPVWTNPAITAFRADLNGDRRVS